MTTDHRNRKGAKRVAMGALQENCNSGPTCQSALVKAPSPVHDHPLVDVDWLSRESVENQIEEITGEVRKQQRALDVARDQLFQAQKLTIHQGVIGLNKDVRKMTGKKLNAAHNCNVMDIVKKTLEAACINSNGMNHEQGSGGNASTVRNVRLKDPAHAIISNTARAPLTVGTTVCRGEKILSERGSPMEQLDRGEVVVIGKKRRANGEVNDFPVSLAIDVGNGECIDLGDRNARERLDEDQRTEAVHQLMAMQEQMKNLMTEWSK